jgi:hypothetical protein
MYDEVTKHIEENVEVQIFASRWWEDRHLRLLRFCRHLTIVYDPHRHSGYSTVWQEQLAAAVSNRKDIKTFHLKGIGEEILGYLSRRVLDDPFGVFAVVDLLAFERIIVMLSTFPPVQASKGIRVTWSGEDKVPLEGEHMDVYRRMVKRIEKGLGGTVDAGMSMPTRFRFDIILYSY